MANRANMTPDERFMDRMEESLNAWQAIVKIFEAAEANQERFCNEVLGLPIAEVRARYRDDGAKRDEILARYETWRSET